MFFTRVRRQEEHVLTLPPFTITSCRFGLWRRGTLTFEWLTWLARAADLSHIEQALDIYSFVSSLVCVIIYVKDILFSLTLTIERLIKFTYNLG